MLHVALKRRPLCGIFGPGVEEDYHLIPGEKIRIQIPPIRRRIEREVVPGGHLRKPAQSFVQKADMRRVFLAGEESHSPEPWLVRDSGDPNTAANQCNNR